VAVSLKLALMAKARVWNRVKTKMMIAAVYLVKNITLLMLMIKRLMSLMISGEREWI
jgi:hypothetical protein